MRRARLSASSDTGVNETAIPSPDFGSIRPIAANTRPQMPRLIIRHSEKSTGRRPSSMSAAWARTPAAFSS